MRSNRNGRKEKSGSHLSLLIKTQQAKISVVPGIRIVQIFIQTHIYSVLVSIANRIPTLVFPGIFMKIRSAVSFLASSFRSSFLR